jgi:deoxyribodipyrimidine photolyase-related protein
MGKNFYIILGNQLFDPKLLKKNNCNEVFMAEDFGLCREFKYHKSKIYLFLAAMREYRDELLKNSIKVNYFELDQRTDELEYVDFLIDFLKNKKIQEINIYEIEDKPFELKFLKKLAQNQIEVKITKSPMFLFSREEFIEMAKGKKTYRMASFYQKARKKLNILIDETGNPVGGKWSFDEDNRKKIPKNVEPPLEIKSVLSKNHHQLVETINKHFKNHPGSLDNIWFPVQRLEAKKQLRNFLKDKFKDFGTYEDAMIEGGNFLYHSCLSALLNIGLLTPDEVISETLKFSEKNSIPLNSLEGFIRQIIGWREFIRGIYHAEGVNQSNSNYWNNSKKLTSSWYDGSTGIEPLDDCIKTTLKDGYIHHIPRLMIISNIMNMCGVHPKEIYKWFMEMYIDSSEWVMVPNVFGMATYSDGGLMSTKPYTCGSNYVLKMSNYKKGDWCDKLDGIYWSFTEKNRKFYEGNPRLSLLTRSLDKLDPERKKRIFKAAKEFINENTV